MKFKNQFLFAGGIILFTTFLLLSCSSARMTSVACPEISVKKNNYNAAKHKRINTKVFAKQNRNHSTRALQRISRDPGVKNITAINSSRAEEVVLAASPEKVSSMSQVKYSGSLLASTDNSLISMETNEAFQFTPQNEASASQNEEMIVIQQVSCDTIVLKSGSILVGKVEEIGTTEIKYRKCSNLTGPVIAVLKSNVSVILYSNGSRDIIAAETPVAERAYVPGIPGNFDTRQVEPLGLAGFISSLVGLFVAGIILGTIAVIFGGISLVKIKNNPSRYKGRGFALVSLILGIVDVVALIILLSAI